MPSSVAAPKMIGPTQIFSVNSSCAIAIGSKPGSQMTRALASLNEGGRNAVNRRMG